jgi:hypothetical protein
MDGFVAVAAEDSDVAAKLLAMLGLEHLGFVGLEGGVESAAGDAKGGAGGDSRFSMPPKDVISTP